MKITWLTTEMGKYTSGLANHNRVFIEYLKNHPEVEKISVVRCPLIEHGILPPERQIINGIEIYNPRVQLKIKNAIESFKKGELNFKSRIQFAFLRLGLKLKGLSSYDSTKITKAGLFELMAVVLLSFEKPFPNPFWEIVANCIRKTGPDIIQSQVEHLSIAGALARDQAKAHLSSQMTLEGTGVEANKGTIYNEFSNRLTDALDWLIKSNRVDLFLPVTEPVKNYLIKYGANPNKIKTLPTPIAFKSSPIVDKQLARERLGLPKNKKILLSVGRMTPRKRFQDLIQILKKLPENVILFIKQSISLSDELGNTSKKLISLINKSKLRDRVIINNSILPYEDMVYVYSACDVAVFPFLDEPYGTCVAECMANGRPIVLYNSGYFPNYINKNGFLIEPMDYEDLYQKTKLILDDEKLASEMGEQSRELARQYDINVVGEKLVNLYKEFL